MRKLIVFDTETGGLDAHENSILSIGMVVWNQGGIEDQLRVLINEGDIFATDEALRVNGLTREQIANEGVSVLQARSEIMSMMLKHGIWNKRITLAGHNVAFDVAFLKRLWRLAGYESEYSKVFSHRSICTQTLALGLELAGRVKWTSTGLDALTQHFGIHVREGGAGGKHDSMEDALATAKLLNELLKFIRDPHRVMAQVQVELPMKDDLAQSGEAEAQ